MATRFYLPSSGNDLSGVGNIPSNQMGWNSVTGDETAQFMYTVKKNSTLTTTALKTSDVTSGWRTHRVKRFVSEPLSAQTISGTISGIIQAYESSTSLNGTLALAVYRVDGDGDYQDTLLSITYSDSTSSPYELYSSLRSRYWYNSSESNSISLTSRNFSSGDRLVIEVGFAESNTTSSRGAYFRFGDPTGSTDFTTYDDTTNTKCPWIEFSANITFQPTSITVTESKSATSKNLLPSNVANGCESGATTGWTENDNDGNLTVTADTSDEYSGSYCLKLAVSGDTASYNFVDTALIPVTPSTYYTVSARAKISSGTYLLGIQWYDSGMGYLTEEYGTFTNTSYSQVYFTKQLPSNAYYVKIFFTIIPGTGARTLCGDEFQLEQNSTYTTWEDPSTAGGNFSESVAVNQLTTKSVTDSDAAAETLTTKNEFLIQCTAWILESILRDITTAIIDGSMITEAIPIDKVSLIPDTLAGTDLAGASSERTLPDNGAGQELINVAVTILLQESFTDAETIILQEFIPLLESVHGIDSHTVKTFLSLLETGTSEEIYNFITRFTQTETPIGADLINTRPEVIETDIGSGIETTQLQNTIPLPDTGTGNDLATLFIQLITMDNVSATTSPILNFFTIISDLMVWTDVVSLGGTGNTITTTDTITITTNALVEVTTPILEGLNATEIASILNVALSQTDQAQGMGLTSILIQLSHTDSIVVTDTLKLDITKNIPDGSTLVEIIAALDNSVKRIQDGVSIIEEFRCGITLLSDDNVTASIISLIKKLLFAGWVTVTFTMEIPWTGLAMPTPATEFETKKPRTVLIME